MTFLQSLLMRLGLLALAAVLCFGGGYWTASRRCRADAEVSSLRNRLESATVNLAQAEKARDDAQFRVTVLEAVTLDTQEAIDDLTDDVLARQNRDACHLSDTDAERLRKIR